MKRTTKVAVACTSGLVVLLMLVLFLHGHSIAVLNPKGTIASQERSLIITATLLGLLVIVPVYILTIFIAWKYRETNHRTKKYTPSWDHSRMLETVWWGIPLILITILSVITWRSSYALDPFKPLSSSAKPLNVQVVALDWKWLFIYPEQHVASINEVQIPVNRPINFEITSDTVMNSFWIPQLSGQIYAMPGMSTQLHLMAGKNGVYKGSSANISGRGFAAMTFNTKAVSQTDFNTWIKTIDSSPSKLSLNAYNQLAKPSKGNPVTYYSSPANNLYEYIIMKYMEPGQSQ